MRPTKAAFAVCVPLTLLVLLVICAAPLRDAIQQGDAAEAERATAGPRPRVVTRAAWGADERTARERSSYVHGVQAVFIHHTNHPNDYDCDDAPAMLRALQADHIRRGWDDIGYNFVVDRCGTIYEGRARAARHAVEGAHTKGFNIHSIGIAALGTFTEGAKVPPKMLESIARIAAWKLQPGTDPHGRTRMTSTSDESRYPKGGKAEFHVISGHLDAYDTSCPGKALYDALPKIRDEAARLLHRGTHTDAGPPRRPRGGPTAPARSALPGPG